MKKESLLQSLKPKYLELLLNFKEEKTQKFTSLILTLLALTFFGIFSINPTLSTIANLNKQLTDNKLLNEALQQKIENLDNLRIEYAKLETSDLPIILTAIPQNSTTIYLTGQLQALAKDYNISITRIQVSQVELMNKSEEENAKKILPDKYSSYFFSFDGLGTYKNISDFLINVANFDRIVNFETISISNDSETKNNLRVSFKGRSYFQP